MQFRKHIKHIKLLNISQKVSQKNNHSHHRILKIFFLQYCAKWHFNMRLICVYYLCYDFYEFYSSSRKMRQKIKFLLKILYLYYWSKLVWKYGKTCRVLGITTFRNYFFQQQSFVAYRWETLLNSSELSLVFVLIIRPLIKFYIFSTNCSAQLFVVSSYGNVNAI